MASSSSVTVTIGDRCFSTTRETLQVDNVPPNRFQKQLEFKDRDPVYGSYVLQYLRGSTSFLRVLSQVEKAMLADEARFYGVSKLQALLEDGSNEVANSHKFSNALIQIRFDLLSNPRYAEWISDDTWWTGMVATLMSFEFFRSIMRSDIQTESLITLLSDLAVRASKTDSDEDDDNDDDDDAVDTEDDTPEFDGGDDEDEQSDDQQHGKEKAGPEKVMAMIPKHDSVSTAKGGIRTSSRRRCMSPSPIVASSIPMPPPPVAPAPVSN